jgi:hypothetical protein
MEIENKEEFKIEIKNEIEEYMNQFPTFFYGNILINCLLLAVIISSVIFIAVSFRFLLPYEAYGLVFLVSVSGVFSITIRNFFRNLRTIHMMRAYDFEIQSYEMDNAVEFFEKLPLKKEEVDRMKIELSYGKLIEIFDLAGIISMADGFYDLSIKFKVKKEAEKEEEEEKKDLESDKVKEYIHKAEKGD